MAHYLTLSRLESFIDHTTMKEDDMIALKKIASDFDKQFKKQGLSQADQIFLCNAMNKIEEIRTEARKFVENKSTDELVMYIRENKGNANVDFPRALLKKIARAIYETSKTCMIS